MASRLISHLSSLISHSHSHSHSSSSSSRGQIQTAQPLTPSSPPGRTRLAIPGCDSVPCRLEQFLPQLAVMARAACVPALFQPALLTQISVSST